MSKAIWPPVPAGSPEWYALQPRNYHTGELVKNIPRTKGGWPLSAVLTPFYMQCLRGGGYVRTLMTDMSSLTRFDAQSVKHMSDYYA